MSDEIIIDGEQFVSSKRASELSGYKQDYIGQLSRGGQIMARRVGGLWYVSSDSLTKYIERAETYKPVPPINNAYRSDPDSLLSFDGKGYISTARGAKLTGYSPDYIGQMSRAGIIASRQVGNRWYVEQAGILAHKESKDSLLAAVQAESVGIKHLGNKVDGFISDVDHGTDAFLEYTTDNGALLPVFAQENPMENVTEEFKEGHHIPIHVVQTKSSVQRGVSGATGRNERGTDIVERIARKNMYSLVFPVMVITIVIVISLGFVSLKTSSTYTGNTLEYGNDGKNFTASAASVLVGRVADTMETFLAPELTYVRGK
ncbi:MAG: hypothetical protein Q7S75_03335 [bacterium]|nr:hypothetical protein [bacterium]